MSLVAHMRRCSKAILNCGGGGGGGCADSGVCPNPKRRTPNHPPYSEMVSVALQSLAEENGSTESSISAYIQSNYNDLPWGHDRLLPYYLRKLVVDGELTSPSPDRYQLAFQRTPFVSLPIRRRGRPRLYPLNDNPSFTRRHNPSFSRRPSAPSRHRGRSQPQRRRGRPRKIRAEDSLLLIEDQGIPPLRRGRESSSIRRGASIGRTATRRLGLRSPRGSKRSRDSFPASNTEELNCQSGNSAFFNDIKNVGSECVALEDPEHIELGHSKMEQGQSFVAPEQSDVGNEQFIGEEPPLLILEPGTTPPFLAPKHYEHVEGQPLQGEELPFEAPEETKFGQDQSLMGEELPLLTPEQGKLLPLLAPELFQDDQGQWLKEEAPPFRPLDQTELLEVQLSQKERPQFLTAEPGIVQPVLAPELFEHDHSQGEAPPFVATEQTELCQDQVSPRERPPFFTPKPGKVPPFSAPEFFELDQEQAPQGEAPSVMIPEQTELVHKQLIEGPPLLTPEQHEHDHGLPLVAPEVSEDGHDQRVPGVGTADSKGGELVPMPRHNEEEVANAAVSSKKRRLHGKRRSLRLWFES